MGSVLKCGIVDVESNSKFRTLHSYGLLDLLSSNRLAWAAPATVPAISSRVFPPSAPTLNPNGPRVLPLRIRLVLVCCGWRSELPAKRESR